MKQTKLIYFLLLFSLGLFHCPLLGQQDFPEELKTREPETLKEVKLLEQRVQTILEKVKPATVSVGGGSGVVISEDGLILTVAHVNQVAGRDVRITFPDGTRVTGKTLGNHHRLDAGLVKISSEGEYPFIDMAETSDRKQGEWCLAVGFPVSFSKGQEPACRLGRVLRSGSDELVSDCVIMGGDSGGPLFNLDGEVIGISSRVNGSLNANIHVPINVYKNNWEKMVAGEDIRQSRRGRRPNRESNRGYLGIRGATDASPAAIEVVIEGSAAEEAGLKVGDVITKIDDKSIDSFADIGESLSGKKVGESISVTVERDGEETEYTIELGKQ